MLTVYNRLTSRRGYLFTSHSMHATTGNRQAFFRRRPSTETPSPSEHERRDERPPPDA